METILLRNRIMRLLCSLSVVIGMTSFAQAQVANIVFDPAPYVVGQTYTATFDYDGSYDVGSTIAVALLDDSGNILEIVGTFTTAGVVVAQELGFTIPEYDNNFEEIRLIAYEGSTFNGVNRVDITQEDFIVFDGVTGVFNSGPATNNGFYLYAAGDRELLTKAYDLTGKVNLELRFNFGAVDGTINVDGDYSVIPRLEYSIDAGNTFNALDYITPAPSVDLPDNFLFQNGFPYIVEIPLALQSETAVHFRWRQPLNGGANTDRWYLYEARLQFDDNEIDYNIYSDNYGPGLVIPPPIGNFNYIQVNRKTVPVFNGDNFTIEWALNDPVNDPNFLAGTGFVFTINSTDPVTGGNIVIASGNFNAGTFTANIPEYITAGTYNVMLTASKVLTSAPEGVDNPYFYYDEQTVSTVRVFNKFVATVYNGDPNAILYAGSNVSFSTDIQNDETNVTDYSDVFFNLTVNYGGQDWLLASRQGGIENPITADLPPFLTGNRQYQIRASLDAPLGEVGQPIDNINYQYTSDANYQNSFLNYSDKLTLWNCCGFNNNELQFNAKNGIRTVTTIDVDMTYSTLLNFELVFNGYDENNPDNNLILEYSIDGGATFSELATYPDMRFNNDFARVVEKLTIPDLAKTANTRLRFRQEEASGTTVRIRRMETTSIPEFPFTLSGVFVNVVRQEVFPSNTTASTICIDEEYTLNYDVKGVFGEEAQLEVRYRRADEGFYRNLGSFDFNAAGELTFTLQEADDQSVVTNPPLGMTDMRFDIRVNDQTYSDIGEGFTTPIVATEQPIQLVPAVNQNTPVSVLVEECGRVVQIDAGNAQNGFVYRLRNRITDAWLSDEVIAIPDEDVRFELGSVVQKIDAEVVVSARNDVGDIICGNSTVLNTTPEINSTVFLIGEDQIASALVLAEDEYYVCESGAINTQPVLRIMQNTRTGFSTSLGGGVTVKWYRDDLNNQVGTGTSFSTFQRSGAYFAVIDNGGCKTTSESVQVYVTPTLETPTISVEGDLQFCEGEGLVVLTAPEGYNRYRWYRNGAEISTGNTGISNSNAITVNHSGNYSVRIETEGGCQSNTSPTVTIIALPTPQTPGNAFATLASVNSICGSGEVDIYLNFLANPTHEYRLINAETETPISNWIQGNGNFGMLITTNEITESTIMKLQTRLLDGSGCGIAEGEEFLVSIRSLEIEVKGNRIIAKPGITSGAIYTWFRNNQVMVNYTGSQIQVYDEAVYSVEVSYTNNTCVLNSGPISFGDNQPVDNKKLKVEVYPNPTEDNISVKIADEYQGNLTLRLTDLNGRAISHSIVRKEMDEQTYSLSLGNLTQGVYNLQVIFEANVVNIKIVKK